MVIGLPRLTDEDHEFVPGLIGLNFFRCFFVIHISGRLVADVVGLAFLRSRFSLSCGMMLLPVK